MVTHRRVRSVVLAALISFSFLAFGERAEAAGISGMENALAVAAIEPYPANGLSASDNPYNTLKVPTQITKIGDLYFIVDCYHDQVLYSNSLDKELKKWKIATHAVKQPHTIAGDGVVYLIDDTENNRIVVLEKEDGKFRHTQTLPAIGSRPHYIVYDLESQSFFAWSSLTGEMYIIKRQQGTNQIYVSEVRSVPELAGYYIRSFTIIGNEIYFPSGNNSYITCVDKDTFAVKARYAVADELAGMAQMIRSGSYFYFTVSTDKYYNQNYATLGRTTDLNTLQYGIYEDLYAPFGQTGTPYYISAFQGSYYMTHHRTEPGIWQFQMSDAGIKQIKELY